MTSYSIPEQRTQAQALVNSFVQSVYQWMAVGLALTGFTAFYVANSEPMLRFIFGNQLIFFGLIIGELAMVWTLSARINKMQASTATMMFLAYSALNGVTLSSIFIVYAMSSIASTFFICSATFVACSVYGMTTKRDLTSFGSFFIMGAVRHHHCFCDQSVSPKQRNADDYQLCRRDCVCGLDRV